MLLGIGGGFLLAVQIAAHIANFMDLRSGNTSYEVYRLREDAIDAKDQKRANELHAKASELEAIQKMANKK